MIGRERDQPECFAHINGAEYFELRKNHEVYGHCAVQIHGEMASIHLVFKRWTLSIFRESLKDWGSIRKNLKIRGITQIVASQDNLEDKKWERFIKHFGFDDVQIVKMAVQEI